MGSAQSGRRPRRDLRAFCFPARGAGEGVLLPLDVNEVNPPPYSASSPHGRAWQAMPRPRIPASASPTP